MLGFIIGNDGGMSELFHAFYGSVKANIKPGTAIAG